MGESQCAEAGRYLDARRLVPSKASAAAALSEFISPELGVDKYYHTPASIIGPKSVAYHIDFNMAFARAPLFT